MTPSGDQEVEGEKGRGISSPHLATTHARRPLDLVMLPATAAFYGGLSHPRTLPQGSRLQSLVPTQPLVLCRSLPAVGTENTFSNLYF